MNYFGKLKLYKNKPTIIAEVGVNHECSLSKAFKLISDAKDSGVEAVKFQTYKANELAIENSPAYWDQKKKLLPLKDYFLKSMISLEIKNLEACI